MDVQNRSVNSDLHPKNEPLAKLPEISSAFNPTVDLSISDKDSLSLGLGKETGLYQLNVELKQRDIKQNQARTYSHPYQKIYMENSHVELRSDMFFFQSVKELSSQYQTIRAIEYTLKKLNVASSYNSLFKSDIQNNRLLSDNLRNNSVMARFVIDMKVKESGSMTLEIYDIALDKGIELNIDSYGLDIGSKEAHKLQKFIAKCKKKNIPIKDITYESSSPVKIRTVSGEHNLNDLFASGKVRKLYVKTKMYDNVDNSPFLEISRKDSNRFDKKVVMVDGYVAQSVITLEKKYSGEDLSYQDKHGNRVIIRNNSYAAIVKHPIPLATSQGKTPLNVELSPIGLPDINGFLFNQKLVPTDTSGGLITYNHSETDTDYFQIGEVKEGIAKAYEAFALDPSSLDKLVIINSDKFNAFVSIANSDAIVILDDCFDVKSPVPLNLVAAHESLHVIDISYDITGDSPLESFHKELITLRSFKKSIGGFNAKLVEKRSEQVTKYFDFIAESNFYADIAPGTDMGHPKDSSSELFATLVMSILHPEWQARIDVIKDPEVKNMYRNSLIEIQESVSGISILKGSPIIYKLAKCIEYLAR